VFADEGIDTSYFATEIPDSDNQCILTARPVLANTFESWLGFTAAHILSLKFNEHWMSQGCNYWFIIPPPILSAGLINSVQNGLCLCGTTQIMLDTYQVSDNPEV